MTLPHRPAPRSLRLGPSSCRLTTDLEGQFQALFQSHGERVRRPLVALGDADDVDAASVEIAVDRVIDRVRPPAADRELIQSKMLHGGDQRFERSVGRYSGSSFVSRSNSSTLGRVSIAEIGAPLKMI